MSSDLWRNINYKYPLKFCHNTFIREYDMSKANINSLLYTNRISKDYYDYLYRADKQTREIQIGLMIQKDPSIYQSIQEGIMEGKKRLFESNDLKDSDILSIALIGAFSDGKTTTIAGWLEEVKDNMKISTDESSDELAIYHPSNIPDKCQIVDTPGLFGDKEKSSGDDVVKLSDITKKYISH